MDARAFARLSALDATGTPVQLDTLWRDRPAVIVWLRHFGCVYCIEQTRTFRAAKPRFDERGAALVFIGNGGVEQLAAFQRRETQGILTLTDPDVRTYQAIGARSGVANTLSPRTWGSALRALRSGARQTSVQGRPFQQGGVLVVLPGGTVAFTHLSARAGDHPAVGDVLAALPATPSRRAS